MNPSTRILLIGGITGALVTAGASAASAASPCTYGTGSDQTGYVCVDPGTGGTPVPVVGGDTYSVGGQTVGGDVPVSQHIPGLSDLPDVGPLPITGVSVVSVCVDDYDNFQVAGFIGSGIDVSQTIPVPSETVPTFSQTVPATVPVSAPSVYYVPPA